MAKGFLVDERSAVTASGTPVPIATASTSIATTSRSITTPASSSSSTNYALSRNIGFDLSSLSTSKNEEKKKSWEIQPPQEEETPVPSAPPITEQPSYYNKPSITLDERSKILAALRKAKFSILHSKSEADEAKGLSEALQEILNIAETASGRMSKRQANEINEEIRQIMIYRNEIKESKKLKQKITDKTNSRDCLDTFSGLIMVSRSISDIFCIILSITSQHLYLTPLIFLLIVTIGSCMFTYFILIGYSYNVYRKINTKSRLGKIETAYCILFTILYGVLASMVLNLPVPDGTLMGPAICGYVSMVTCILQRCLKCDANSTSKGNYRKRSSCNDIMFMEVGNNITLHCNAETIGNNRENTIDRNHDSESRIVAVDNLKTRIQNTLTGILGEGNMSLEKTVASERNTSSRSENNTYTDTIVTASENYGRTNFVHNTVVNYDTSIHRTNDSCFDFWMFWNTLNSPPAHSPGDGAGCCNFFDDCCEFSCDGCKCCEGDCCDNIDACCDDTEGCCEYVGGDSGDFRDYGDYGDTGNHGDTGDYGDCGNYGDTGDYGDCGNYGDTGDYGNCGDDGGCDD